MNTNLIEKHSFSVVVEKKYFDLSPSGMDLYITMKTAEVIDELKLKIDKSFEIISIDDTFAFSRDELPQGALSNKAYISIWIRKK
jgi:hypothetical protein